MSSVEKWLPSKSKVSSESYVWHIEQVAQLSQRDRAAGWISYGQKWKTGTGRQYYGVYRSIFNH